MLPKNFYKELNSTLNSVRNIEGYLTEREMKFLFLAGSCSTAEGEVLEIGSFKGKSTIILSRANILSGGNKIVAVDPLTSPSITDPDLKGKKSVLEEFQNNIQSAGIKDAVEFHQMFSHELSASWQRNIRLLWIDGDHTYSGTKKDFDMFSKFLSNGAIIALHDVLARFDGPIRVFMEDILLSDRFGQAGIWGSIGWAQYLGDKEIARRYTDKKLMLYSKLSRLIPFSVFQDNKVQSDIAKKLRYKLWRAMVPHAELSPSEWLNKVIRSETSHHKE